MLKGLKLKTKLPDKDSNTSTQPSQSRQTEETYDSSSKGNKRWLKTSDDQPQTQKKPLIEEEKLTEDDLVSACEDIWKSFMEGQIENTQNLLKDLKRKERKVYDSMREEVVAPAHPAVVNFNILEDKDEDVFESIERTALKNFDPRKSAYLITDIMSETVKNKGKSDDSVYKLYKKRTKNTENLFDEEYDTKEAEEQDENKKKSKRDKKAEEKEKRRETMQKNRVQRVLANCRFCLGNNQIMEEQILSFSPNALLILPDIKKYERNHFFIIPLEHTSSLVELEEEQYDEIKNYMKCLVTMYDKMDYGVAFMETYIDIEKSPHCVVEVVAMPRDVHEELPLYFKKALSELESEWSTHKKIIEIKKEKGGIRKQIPKNFPYFYIDFDTAYGYAHVIEKTKEHNRNFAHEIIGSLLDIDKSMTMFPKKYERNEFSKKKDAFQNKWSDYDWTQVL